MDHEPTQAANDPPQAPQLSRYESQKRTDWNIFLQYLQLYKPPLNLPRCSGANVIEFLKYVDHFGKTKVHMPGCPFFGQPNPPAPCPCPLKQAWGTIDALIGRLRAAYEENGGTPDSNPFAARAVRIYLREVRETQAKARGVAFKKKKRKRTASASATGEGSSGAPPSRGGMMVAYSASARHPCLKVVENNYCTSRRGGVRCLSILNILFALIFSLMAIFLGSSLLTGSTCSVPLFWCYAITSWSLVTLYAFTAIVLRRKASTINGENEFDGEDLGLKTSESVVEVTPEVERRVNEGFKMWMGSSLLSKSDDEEDHSGDVEEGHPMLRQSNSRG